MTLSELKPGYLVRCKDGHLRMVMPTRDGLILAREPECYGTNTYLHLDGYDSTDMTHKTNSFTIMKVYGYNAYEQRVFDFSTQHRDLLWERKEKKKYTYAQLREILGEEFEVVG